MSNFWDQRVGAYGHTSWSNRGTYLFEYFLKKRILKTFIGSLQKKVNCLDFGCGVGDYSFIASNYFKNVDAFDSSAAVLKVARVSNSAKNITYMESKTSYLKSNFYDCILAVSVLQHLDIVELTYTLKQFSLVLSEGGKIFVINTFSNDFFLDNSYTTFYDLDLFAKLCSANNLDLDYVESFWHPDFSKSLVWIIYRFTPFIYLTRFTGRLQAEPILRLLKFYALFCSFFVRERVVDYSPQKIVILTKRK